MDERLVRIDSPGDINWDSLVAVAYEKAKIEFGKNLLDKIDQGRKDFLRLIENGVPCYGVTTGLGKLVTENLSEDARRDLPKNILRARAVAIGPSIEKPVVRAMMFVRLANFVSGKDGVSPTLCQFLVDRLNDDFTPWVPVLGHGMGADATANSHAFQTFIGEGYVFGPDGTQQAASQALNERGVKPYEVLQKEGLALINGITIAPAYALHAYRRINSLCKLATAVAAVSIEGMAVPKDAYHPQVKHAETEPGVGETIDILNTLLRNSAVQHHKLQAPVSYRVIPQVHGALLASLNGLRASIENNLTRFSDNPIMVTDDSDTGGRFLSVGLFHNQHLVNQVEHAALALAHVGVLSERRLHRLMDAGNTGLSAQLAVRPGLDAGLVTAHKAVIDFTARLRVLAQPVSLLTGDTSGGQEDYMSMVVPATARLFDMVELTESLLAYELLGGLTAVAQRDQIVGEGVDKIRKYFTDIVPIQNKDYSPGPVVEKILAQCRSDKFQQLLIQM